jgi:hypothetical protein
MKNYGSELLQLGFFCTSTSAKSFDGQQGENETFRREPTKMNAQAPSNLPKKSSLPGVSGNRQKPSPPARERWLTRINLSDLLWVHLTKAESIPLCIAC